MNTKQSLGFTLLELMIVVAIVGIVASIAVPSFQATLDRNLLKQVTESFKSDLQFARNTAIKLSQNIRINRTTGNDGAWCYGLTTNDLSCDCTEATTTETDYCEIKRVLGNEFNPTNMVSATGNSTFNFRRGTIGANGVTFSSNIYASRVVFSSGGRIRICSPTTMPTGKQSLPNVEDC